MKALSTLQSAIDQSSSIGIIALVLLTPFIFPKLAFAQTLEQSKAPLFEINVSDLGLLNPAPKPTTTQNSISINDIAAVDPLVVSLDAYLTDRNSPLAGSAKDIVTYPYWHRALGISLVESSMCVHTPKVKTKNGWIESYNCSGIGGDNYHIYTSYMDWFKGMNDLLGQPNYVNRPIEKFLRYYVQPGSLSWLYGVQKTEAQLDDMETQAQVARQELAQKVIGPITTALTTFPDSTKD